MALTGVERWNEGASWRAATLSGLVWGVVVAGAWWFAEWTQIGRRREVRPGSRAGTGERSTAAGEEDGQDRHPRGRAGVPVAGRE
ncbi:hypothetical protein ACFWUQ_03375 [Streptomyces sp. NPDC058662]|uniref:hypothetical protein n=1 Tax=Streptomyces sp. NPDC058662 TaxID=3346583 RepID=UPI003653FA79